MLLLFLSLASPASADDWVAVRADALHCVQTTAPQAADAPCVRLTGSGSYGAVLARVVADDGDSLVVQWVRAERASCVASPPPPLADLGLTLRVSKDALLPVVSEATILDLGDGASLELRPGLPLWPAEDHDLVVVHLAGLELVVRGSVPTAPIAAASPGLWPTNRAMSIDRSALPSVDDLILAPLGAQSAVSSLWDEDNRAIVVQEDCARLVLPASDGAAAGRPDKHLMDGLIGKRIEATIPPATVLTLPSGRPVGKTTATVTVGAATSGLDSAAANLGSRLTNPRGGRSCAAFPTTADTSLPWAERNLELCAATATLKRSVR